jgi:hypothetical protein
MNLKSILLTAAATIGLTAATMAQVPNYIPTNGLVGWWPFNGNANDESGNQQHLNQNGNVVFTHDRYGNSNSSGYFTGNGYLYRNNAQLPIGNQDRSVSFWVNQDSILVEHCAFAQYKVDACFNYFGLLLNGPPAAALLFDGGCAACAWGTYNSIDTWVNYTLVYENSYVTLYKNGVPLNTAGDPYYSLDYPLTTQENFAIAYWGKPSDPNYFIGAIDDFGFWNRALSPLEISTIFNASSNCSNNLTLSPATNQLQTGSTANFIATTSDPNPTYVWQSDLGQGFQTLNNVGNYSGANSATLNIANVQLPNHTQPIRVITTSGNCIDTSNVAVINLIDTCIAILTINDTITTQVFDTTYVTQTIYDTLQVTIYDTLLTAVTDTLIINSVISGLNPPNNLNTMKLFPNPASTHITIDYGNFNAMSGYTLTIVNSIGQTVFTTPINQQTSFVDLSTWTGNGIYFVKLIDPQNNIIENRKIVIQ